MSDLIYVNIKTEHAEQLEALQRLVFPNTPPDELFHADEFRHHVKLFPEGSFVVLDGDKVVGLGAGIFTDFDFGDPQHSLEDAMGDGYYKNHRPDGPWYYGTDISVHPDYRRRGIGQRLYELRKDLVRRYNKKGIVAGGLLPGFKHYRHELTPMEYILKVIDGELYDPTLTFQLQNGFRVRGYLHSYFRHPSSSDYATLIVWENPAYEEGGRC